MALSNTTLQILRSSPYFDDYDASKAFLRILFRPGKAVQTRELTQLQTLLQAQLGRFGGNVFKDGAPIAGAQMTVTTTAVTLRLQPSFGGANVNTTILTTNATSTVIIRGNTSFASARVVGTVNNTIDDAITLVVVPVGAGTFQANEILTYRTNNTSMDTAFAQITTSNNTPIQPACVASIDAGTFFIDGFFVDNQAQSCIVSSDTNTPTARVGFAINETIVTESDDPSLTDPAFGQYNYGAPGAHRLRLDLTLSARELTSQDLDTGDVTTTGNFIELIRLDTGVVTQNIPATAYSRLYADLETALARRTYDEAGDYLVKPFVLGLTEFDTTLTGTVSVLANSTIVTGNNTVFTGQITPGDTITIANTVASVSVIANNSVLYVANTWTSNATGVTAKASRPASIKASLSAGKAYVQGYEFETVGTSTLDIPKARDVDSVVNQHIPLTLGNFTTIDTLIGNFATNTYEVVDLHCVSVANINPSTTSTYTPTKIGSCSVRNVVPNGPSANGTYSYTLYPSSINLVTIAGNVAANSTVASGLISLDANAALVANAYIGAQLILVDANGNTATFPVATYTVNATHQIAGVTGDVDAVTVNTLTTYRVSFGIGQTQAIATTNGSALLKSANISPLGQFNGQTILSNPTPLIYRVPQSFIQTGTMSGVSYDIDTVLSNTHSSNTCVIRTPNASVRFYPSTNYTYSNTEIDELFIITAANGSVLHHASIASMVSDTPGSTDVHSLTINTLGVSSANLTVAARVSVISLVPRTKTYTGANSTTWANTVSNGQIQINSPNTTPGGTTSLTIPDVVSIIKVIDTLSATDVTTAMLSNSSYDVTTNYSLDVGQQDGIYNHSHLVLKPSAPPARGRLGVVFTRFAHAGTGPVTLDSYSNVTYESIPTYVSPTTGTSYVLRDMIDFRPIRDVGANTISSIETPDPTSLFIASYSYYLPRIDKIALTPDRQFVRIPGLSAVYPVAPPDWTDAMTLYNLSFPAYTISPRAITTSYIDHKRYTMSDINSLDKRLGYLEYYTALSQMEQLASNTPLFDDNNQERFKNGILVDPFTGHGVGDVTRTDYFCSIDPTNHRLLPGFTSNQASLTLYSNTSSNFSVSPDQQLAFIHYDETIAITQPIASMAINVNPFNVTNFRGTIAISPDGDTWFDTTTRPAVTINLGGTNDDAESVANTELFGTTWGDWQTRWAGQPADTTQTQTSIILQPDARPDSELATVQRTVVDTTTLLKRDGTQFSLTPTSITQSLGSRIVDLSVIPYMRANTVQFAASGLKPGAIVYAFFDGVDVTRFIERANELTLSGPATLFGLSRGSETVTSGATGVGVVVGSYANTVYVLSDLSVGNGSFLYANGAPTPLTGALSAQTVSVVGYTHWSGNVLDASPTTVTLDASASRTVDFYDGLTLTLTSGSCAGASGIITGYDYTTKIATVTLTGAGLIPGGNTITAPVGSRYSIGPLQTSNLYTTSAMAGSLCGALHLPAQSFPTGAKVFRLVDSPINVPNDSSTIAEALYTAQGFLETTEDVSVSTRSLQIQTTAVTQITPVTTVSQQDQTLSYIDPLAQTFLIDGRIYPQGFFLTSIDLFFATADTAGLPVTVQIRPMVNGFPSSSIVVAEAVLPASAINTANTPTVTDATTATTFTFPQPVQLQGGTEYAFVVLSDSQVYTIYVSQMGGSRIGTNEMISTQPYAGSLFTSQNATTWTPVQDQDLMFVIRRAEFSANVATIGLWANVTSNIVADAIYIQPGVAQFTNTSLTWALQTTDANNVLQGNGNSRAVYLDTTTTLPSRVSLIADGNTMLLTSTLTTQNDAVSPIIDLRRLAITTIEYAIDNGGLVANACIIQAVGNGYPVSNTTLPVVITGTTGTGANVYATTNSSGMVTGVIINAGGSGYTTSPTLTINAANSAAATLVYVGEDAPQSTQSEMRYMTRPVTLADGFDAMDLHVTIGAYKPANTNIDVYYKVLSATDPDPFDAKSWMLMSQDTDSQIVSRTPTDTQEYIFVTPNTSAAYVANNVTYTQFKTYAIKIILRSPSTTLIPFVTNLRVIAVDS